MKIAIGADHGGFELKKKIIDFFSDSELECEFEDYGTYSEESVDYSDYAIKVGEAVAQGLHDLGIVICSTGIGVSIAANKVKGIRAAHCTDSFSAKMARNHNNANVLALGGKISGIAIVLEMVSIFLCEDFDGGRHERRVNKINQYE